MNTVKKIFSPLIFITFLVKSVFAFDFYGAFVTYKDTPSSYMRCGIYGYHSVISDIKPDSPAQKAGFKQGDIIMSVNDKLIGRPTDLTNYSENILAVRIFNGLELNTLTINFLELELKKKKAIQLEAEQKAAALNAWNRAHSSPPTDDQPDESPPLRFDDSMIANVTSNEINSRPDSLENSPSNASNEDWSDDNNQDLQGINW